jgi:hypothetical protein
MCKCDQFFTLANITAIVVIVIMPHIHFGRFLFSHPVHPSCLPTGTYFQHSFSFSSIATDFFPTCMLHSYVFQKKSIVRNLWQLTSYLAAILLLFTVLCSNNWKYMNGKCHRIILLFYYYLTVFNNLFC